MYLHVCTHMFAAATKACTIASASVFSMVGNAASCRAALRTAACCAAGQAAPG